MVKKIAVLVVIVAATGFAGWWLLRTEPAPARTNTSSASALSAAAPTLAYEPIPIGAPASEFGRPMVTNLQLFDLDGDGLLDVLYCDARKNTIRWIRQAPRGVFNEHVI